MSPFHMPKGTAMVSQRARQLAPCSGAPTRPQQAAHLQPQHQSDVFSRKPPRLVVFPFLTPPTWQQAGPVRLHNSPAFKSPTLFMSVWVILSLRLKAAFTNVLVGESFLFSCWMSLISGIHMASSLQTMGMDWLTPHLQAIYATEAQI